MYGKRRLSVALLQQQILNLLVYVLHGGALVFGFLVSNVTWISGHGCYPMHFLVCCENLTKQNEIAILVLGRGPLEFFDPEKPKISRTIKESSK